MERIGFIGLGVMGSLMCKRLLMLGRPVFVTDVNQKAVQDLVGEGAAACSSAEEVAQKSDIILASLPNAKIVEDVVFGESGLLKGIRKGSVFIDLSSSTPMATQKIGKALMERGAEMLDAPVSRGAPAAREGTLSIMVGGKKEVMDRCMFIFRQLGTDIIHVGDLGSGHAIKALNNLLSATNLIAACEAAIIAKKAGVDPKKFIDVINVSSGASHMTKVRFPKYYLPRQFNSGFTIGLMHKDCCIALEMAQQHGVPMLFTGMTPQVYSVALGKGMNSEDNTIILLIMEELMNASMEN
jgi:3-hydroxyisobutyrate dehydrogenase-like beta-hydroxyacid dehydrogenase